MSLWVRNFRESESPAADVTGSKFEIGKIFKPISVNYSYGVLVELKKIKEDDKNLILEIGGETFSVANALREELWEDKSVSESAQIREHPYLSQPKIFVKTERGFPVAALEKAAERILEQAKEFQEEFKKALKK